MVLINQTNSVYKIAFPS